MNRIVKVLNVPKDVTVPTHIPAIAGDSRVVTRVANVRDRLGRQFQVDIYFIKAGTNEFSEHLDTVLAIIIATTELQGSETDKSEDDEQFELFLERVRALCERIQECQSPLYERLGFRVWYFSSASSVDALITRRKNRIYSDALEILSRKRTADVSPEEFENEKEFDFLCRNLGREIKTRCAAISIKAGEHPWLQKT